MTEKQNKVLLRGTALEIYNYLLKTGRPSGIRETQKALKLSSPSVAQYHLSKLERAGIVKKERGNYSVNKVVLKNRIYIRGLIVPKQFFYCLFALGLLLVEVFFLKRDVIDNDLFAPVAIFALLVIFSYETIAAWRSDGT